MAASTAQIHALGATAHFATSNVTSRNPSKTVFLGRRLNNTVSFGLKMKNRVGSSFRRNPGVGPFRVVAEVTESASGVTQLIGVALHIG